MSRYSLVHLSDEALLHQLTALVSRDRSTTAELLAHIAEVDARKLYVPAAYPTMFAYCIGELRLSEDAAAKRIHAARAARRFPSVFNAIAEGRLHLSAVVLLAPHLTEDNAAELLAAAVHKSKSEIERLLAERFPRADVLAWVSPIPARSDAPPVLHAPGHAGGSLPRGAESPVAPESVTASRAPEHVVAHAPHPGSSSAHVSSHAPGHVNRFTVRPLSAGSFEVLFTMNLATHDKLRYAQELLSHQVPSGDVAEIFERALDALIPKLEKARFAATDQPRRGQPSASSNPRRIPAHVMREVWARDGGQCTFMSESGRRCAARKFVQFDHVVEVARGGEATAGGLRLRCRAHNQYAAECTFGTEFMRHKQIAAAEARARSKVQPGPARRTALAGGAPGGSRGVPQSFQRRRRGPGPDPSPRSSRSAHCDSLRLRADRARC